MRIDRETLLKNARDLVAKRAKNDYNILAVYLCGSMLEEEYLLGGAADADLVFIHLNKVTQAREIIRLTDDIHLDIAHQLQDEYIRPQLLRTHPWLGPTLFSCKPIYDPRHFLDFTQASVRGQFDRPDYVMERASPQLEHAREIWLSLRDQPGETKPKGIEAYLRAIWHAVNAVALLTGPPLTERRFLLKFPQYAQAVGRPGLAIGLYSLLGASNVDVNTLQDWLPAWQEAVSALSPPEMPTRLHQNRRNYYLRAFQAILEKDEPRAVLWPLLNTWTLAVLALPEQSLLLETWRSAFRYLGLLGAAFSERVAALDAYLDLVEETLEAWARENGA